MQCERGNSKIVIGDSGLSTAGAELLQPCNQLVCPSPKRVVNVEPGIQRILSYCRGAVSLVYGRLEQFPVRRIRRIAYGRRDPAARAKPADRPATEDAASIGPPDEHRNLTSQIG